MKKLVRELLQWSRMGRKGSAAKKRLTAWEKVEVEGLDSMRKWKHGRGESKGVRNEE